MLAFLFVGMVLAPVIVVGWFITWLVADALTRKPRRVVDPVLVLPADADRRRSVA